MRPWEVLWSLREVIFGSLKVIWRPLEAICWLMELLEDLKKREEKKIWGQRDAIRAHWVAREVLMRLRDVTWGLREVAWGLWEVI